MRRTIALLAGVLLAPACTDSPTTPRAASELLAAPTAITVGARSLVLEPYVYRDFMPGGPAGGSPMIAGLRIRATDGAALPRTLRADSVWVIAAPHVWSALAGEHRFSDSAPFTYESVARGGPTWTPGTRIDVVVRVRDGGGGSPRLLRAADQVVQATY
jgi:hypothetical protein